MKPFIKIPGGKSKLLPSIINNLPKTFDSLQWTYIEPFTGGGAVVLALLEKYNKSINKIIINDLNKNIHNLWLNILNNPTDLMEQLTILDDDGEAYYYNREQLNKLLDLEDNYLYSLQKASLFLYNNKHCFNGLIRTNKQGKYNTPKGNYYNVKLYNKDNILAIYNNFKTKYVRITNKDFQQTCEELISSKFYTKNTLVYLDPPYIPKSITANFTSYTPQGFSLYDHRRLKLVLDLLDSKNINFLLSNADTPFTRELFKGYNIVEITAKRSIAAKSSSRADVKELLIKNY